MATVERKEAPGALSHLFEAATALAGMNEFQVPAQTMDNSSRASVISDEDASSKRVLPVKTSPSSASKREIFPQRLLAILDDPSLSDIVTWLPHGRSFVIIRPDVFTEKVLPKYLPPVDSRGSTKYPSFTRKLNRWGFRQATRGPDTGAFHHPMFRRDQPELCLNMVCQRSRDRKSPEVSQPPKKRAVMKEQVLPLTKEALDTMLPPASTAAAPVPVSDDGCSETSLSTPVVAVQATLRQGISNDSHLVAAAMRQRDAEERLRGAKAMLYHSYLMALKELKGE